MRITRVRRFSSWFSRSKPFVARCPGLMRQREGKTGETGFALFERACDRRVGAAPAVGDLSGDGSCLRRGRRKERTQIVGERFAPARADHSQEIALVMDLTALPAPRKYRSIAARNPA